MTTYMLIANQTVRSRELLEAVLRLQALDDSAEFTLVVPATRVPHGLVWDEVETRAAAQACLELGMVHLRAAGCRVIEGSVGDENPVLAMDDELRRRRYTGIVISTLPPGLSRWLKLDVVSRIRRKLPPGRSLEHVIGILTGEESVVNSRRQLHSRRR
jgi:hypothetical protein